MSDPRTKVAQTLGDLLLSNLEMAAALETAQKELADLKKIVGDLQAAKTDKFVKDTPKEVSK